MSRRIAWIVGLLLVVHGIGSAGAAEYPTLFRGIRPLGMGGAFIAVPDDSDAMFYNPASLAAAPGVFKVGVPLPVPLIEISQSTRSLLNDAKDLKSGSSISEINDVLQKHLDENLRVRAAFVPTVSFHAANLNFGVAVLTQVRADLAVHGRLFPVLSSEYARDIGLLGSAAAHLLSGRIDVGATLKFVQRDTSIQRLTAFQISADGYDPRQDSKTKSDFAMDLGLNYHLIKDLPVVSMLNPTASVVLQNITQLDLIPSEFEQFSQGRVLPYQVNVGLSVSPSVGIAKTIIAYELDDVSKQLPPDSEHDNYLKRTHLGLEVQIPFVAVRVGMNQGYGTAGVTLKLAVLEISYTTYAEQLGVDKDRQSDRRHVVQMGLAF